MCRIAGFWDFNFNDQYNLEKTAIRMRDPLSNGGPDDAGLYVDLSLGLALAHRRLSILDLSPLDPPKMGFGVPIYEWFKGELKGLYLEYLSKERIKKEGIFNSEEVDKLLRGYLENKGVNHNKLWFLFIFQLWRERWL